MTIVIGSIQLKITRVPPMTNWERLQRDIERRLLERRIEAVRQETFRQAALNAFGIPRG